MANFETSAVLPKSTEVLVEDAMEEKTAEKSQRIAQQAHWTGELSGLTDTENEEPIEDVNLVAG